VTLAMIVTVWNKISALKMFIPIDIYSPTYNQVVLKASENVLTDRMCLLVTDRRQNAADPLIVRQLRNVCTTFLYWIYC
jgi:hypothetical protein